MPLKRGYSRKVLSHNFRELKEAQPRMSQKQRTAIVLDTARRTGGKRARRKLARKRGR